jgi:hypothetical protein
VGAEHKLRPSRLNWQLIGGGIPEVEIGLTRISFVCEPFANDDVITMQSLVRVIGIHLIIVDKDMQISSASVQIHIAIIYSMLLLLLSPTRSYL